MIVPSPCRRPTVFFRHLRIVALSIPQGETGTIFRNVMSIPLLFFNLRRSDISWLKLRKQKTACTSQDLDFNGSRNDIRGGVALLHI
jgi:hypothetical protein